MVGIVKKNTCLEEEKFGEQKARPSRKEVNPKLDGQTYRRGE
jgi:hypothetical protein